MEEGNRGEDGGRREGKPAPLCWLPRCDSRARGRGLQGMPHFLMPGLGLLKEELFPRQRLLFPFEPEPQIRA